MPRSATTDTLRERRATIAGKLADAMIPRAVPPARLIRTVDRPVADPVRDERHDLAARIATLRRSLRPRR